MDKWHRIHEKPEICMDCLIPDNIVNENVAASCTMTTIQNPEHPDIDLYTKQEDPIRRMKTFWLCKKHFMHHIECRIDDPTIFIDVIAKIENIYGIRWRYQFLKKSDKSGR